MNAKDVSKLGRRIWKFSGVQIRILAFKIQFDCVYFYGCKSGLFLEISFFERLILLLTAGCTEASVMIPAGAPDVPVSPAAG